MNHIFKFSVIMPVYNVEKYLEEAVESIINQDIGFKKNIQLILINDGSTDKSGEICKKYKDTYPDNIIYIEKKNEGVSAARNDGIKKAQGKYINFLDSDDKWKSDAFTKAYNMFEKYDDIDLIGARIKNFEGNEEYHPLDYKFTKDRVIDIFNHYDYIQLSSASAFFRADAIKDMEFDTRVKYSEDSKFVNELILKKEKYGVLSSTLYYYRKRITKNSAVQTKQLDKSWYLDTPKLCYKYIADLSIKKYGYVIPFVQYYIAYDYKWRVGELIPDTLFNEVKDEYLKVTKELFENIEDYIIMQQENFYPEYKAELLSFKHGYNIKEKYSYISHRLYFNNYMFLDFKRKQLLELNTITIKNNKIKILGVINYCIPNSDYDVYLVTNNEKIKLDLKPSILFKRYFFNKQFASDQSFEVEVSLEDLKFIKFQTVYKEKYITDIDFITTKNSKIEVDTNIFYRYKNKIIYYDKGKIKIKSARKKNIIKYSKKLLLELLKERKFNIIATRTIYHICKKFKKKQIWLISDRIDKADDNGEHFFKYINSQEKNISTYFVIDKKCSDFAKMKKYGKVINFGSFKHKILFLLSNKLISSQADDIFINLFEDDHIYYHDLYNFKFIFLQHGIAEKDLSAWLNCFSKKIDLFICTAKPEYDSVINGNYGYHKENVALTGLARYDNLTNDPKNEIAIIPTWRASLAGSYNPETKRRDYSDNFKNSDYFEFYNKLINDKEIIETLKKSKFEAKFYMHPNHCVNIDDFDQNDCIEIVKEVKSYQKIFAESNLLITDYSSVAFDFAYLKKPIIYTQFDSKDFYSKQVYDKGYFEYEKDGFGPVCYDYESAKKTIINMIKNNCKLDSKYEKRINGFFKFTDKNNCERIYKAIKENDKNE